MRRLRWPAAVLACVVLILGAIVLHDRHSPGKPLLHARTDFTTFYCAGEVTRERADPYRVEPMRACEHRLGEFDEPGRASWEVIPAPFPGYLLAFYALMSRVPFGIAHVLWLGALLSALGVATWALARVTGFHPVPVAIVLAAIVGFWDLAHGEPTPIVVMLLALAAERASRGAWTAAGVLTALAAIMPQLALPACLALLLFAPRARVALLATLCVLAVVSLAALGVAENVEYFARTLPQQAVSEVYFDAQFSVTHLLAMLGVSERVALPAGSISYVVLVALGIAAGARLMRLNGQPAALVLIPPAIASVGGAYSHDMQVLTAVAATLLFASLPGVPSRIAVVPLVIFSVLWIGDSAWRGLLAVTSLSALAALWLAADRLELTGARRWRFIGVSAVALAAAFGTLHLLPTADRERDISRVPSPVIAASDPIATVWTYRNRLPPFMRPDLRFEALKVPYVFALAVIAGCALGVRGAARSGQPPARSDAVFSGASSRTIVS
jgi:hypothetical protein